MRQQPPHPARVFTDRRIERSLAGPGRLAIPLISMLADRVPLYLQSVMYTQGGRQSITQRRCCSHAYRARRFHALVDAGSSYERLPDEEPVVLSAKRRVQEARRRICSVSV